MHNKILSKNKVIHFIGIGGIGMSGLAKLLLELEYKVSGSDIKDSPVIHALADSGGRIFMGHCAKNIDDASCVVISTAIKPDNAELTEAKKRNLPIFHRSQILEALMSGLEEVKQISIGVAGTHGKTTTSGMLSLVFEDAMLDPSFVVGGIMPYLNINSKLGKGDYFIAELDESDGTIAAYSPDFSIITNLEFDHPDHYKNGFAQVLETFENYVKNLKTGSKIIINADCAGNKQLLKKINHPGIILYSTDSDNELHKNADYTAEDIIVNGLNTSAKVYKNGKFIGKFNSGAPGLHNISNGLAVVAAGLECGIKFQQIASSLARFTGMGRRFQILSIINGAQLVDDYAHHPTEVQVTLKTAKGITESAKSGRVIAIFQPHRYSRLANLWNEFTLSFKDADIVYICDVYAAGEAEIKGISSKRLAKELLHDDAHYISGGLEKISGIIIPEIKADDIVLTMGAGTITNLGPLIIKCKGN